MALDLPLRLSGEVRGAPGKLTQGRKTRSISKAQKVKNSVTHWPAWA